MQPEINYFIHPEAQGCTFIIQYLTGIIARQFNIVYRQQQSSAAASLIFAASPGAGVYHCDTTLYNQLTNGAYRGAYEALSHDELLAAFYLLQCVQEYHAPQAQFDELGRFRYDHSLQQRLGNVQADVVSDLFLKFIRRTLPDFQTPLRKDRKLLLTHDIDILQGGLRQEATAWLRRQGNYTFFSLLQHLAGTRKVWDTLEEIQRLEKKYEAGSVFYFIPRQGEAGGISNADYSVAELKDHMLHIREQGNEIGLHKSVFAGDYAAEMAALPLTQPYSNRNHFIRYRLPETWQQLEAAGLRADTGLGYPYNPGLRNNYPFPFRPAINGQIMQLVVTPMVLMDTAYDKYSSPDRIIEDFKKMSSGWENGFCVSVLFHNNYLSRGANHLFLEAYEALLAYCQEQEIGFTNIGELVNTYG